MKKSCTGKIKMPDAGFSVYYVLDVIKGKIYP